jgi:hypothetical protein
MEPVQTRLPAFLWDALQDVFYEHDVQFLRDVAPLVGVSVTELKKTILGTMGQRQTVMVSKQGGDAWWEGQLCPLRVRNEETAHWRPCGHFREAHGFCSEHRTYKQPTSSLRHREDPEFQSLASRKPVRWNDSTVWVDAEGWAVDGEGRAVEGLQICPLSGILLKRPVGE